METTIQQSLRHKVVSSISVFSVSLRKWKTSGTDLLDTLTKYNFLFSEVPSTHSASISENANVVFFCLFSPIYIYLKLKEDGTLCMMKKKNKLKISLWGKKKPAGFRGGLLGWQTWLKWGAEAKHIPYPSHACSEQRVLWDLPWRGQLW